MSRPRVVHIIDRLPPDGAERLLCELLQYRSNRFDYSVLCLVEGGEFEQIIRDMGVPIVILGKKPGVDFRMLWRLWRWLRTARPQVVHTHLFTADTWGRLAARLALVPQVYSTVHSVNTWQGRVHKLVDRVLALVSTRLIACTGLVAEKLINSDGVASDKVITLANAVDLNRFRNVKPVDLQRTFSFESGVPVIAVLGRLEPVKGQAFLIRCLSVLRDSGVEANCLIIGDGPDRTSLEEQVGELGLGGRVAFAGFRRDVPELLAAIDILAIPSQWEGLPMALLEAMALSRCVVAHSVGGIPDVMTNDIDGVLVPAGNVALMKGALQRAVEDGTLRKRLGEAAGQRIKQHYSAEVLSAAYEEIYISDMARNSTRENAQETTQETVSKSTRENARETIRQEEAE